MPHVNTAAASRPVAAGARIAVLVFVITTSAFAIEEHAVPWTAHETVALRTSAVAMSVDRELASFYYLPAQIAAPAGPATEHSGSC